MSCRDEIHSAVRSILAKDKGFFTVDEVIDLMRARGTAYSPTTIRTQITSALCANAPKNHGTTYPDFERIGPGMYRPTSGMTGAVVIPATSLAAAFEAKARTAMEERYGVKLPCGSVPAVPKRFDFVSPDESIVGDAKFYTLVNGVGIPPAKHSTIAEYVWLLEKTGAQHKFLVFGNDRRVPQTWLKRFGKLTNVQFFFMDESDAVIEMTPPL